MGFFGENVLKQVLRNKSNTEVSSLSHYHESDKIKLYYS